MSQFSASDFQANLNAAHTEITRHAKHLGLSKAQAPKAAIMAVSKRQPDTRVDAALAAGQRLFGENIVQEAQSRWAERRATYPDLKLHLIGSLQSRKAADAVALFDVIETLDRSKLADKLKAAMDAQNRQLPVFIQVNTGEEPQKGGVLPADLPALIAHARDIGLDLQGLMCIPPKDHDPALHFALLLKWAQAHNIAKLSMGMSSDYAIAAAMGADFVRIGTALFGDRTT